MITAVDLRLYQKGWWNHYEIDELPGLNHLFQTAKTGAITEYDEIEETMSRVAMEKVASWILKQTGGTETSMAKAAAY